MTAGFARTDPTRGKAFDDKDVADAYANRPPYPAALHHELIQLSSGRHAALDLGCGPGKLARVLADHFEIVDAVDPAGPMIDAGKALDHGAHPNIVWIEATAESAPMGGPYDLATAGASIHWMDHALLFPRLVQHLAPKGIVAIVGGDEPHDPPWANGYKAMMAKWIPAMGGRYDPVGFSAAVHVHEAWMDIAGRKSFTSKITQRIDDFIDGEHSRGTWVRSKMGARAEQFDADMHALLSPHAQDGVLTFEVVCGLTYGRPRSSPKPIQ